MRRIDQLTQQIDNFMEWPDSNKLHVTTTSAVCFADAMIDKYTAHLQAENDRLRNGITRCIEKNLHLADGDNCTLIDLKSALKETDK